jgi:pre-mRNA-splicing factor CDC5/CEF1
LPRAKNDFELVAPGDTASESGGDTDTDGSMGEWQEDAADVGARAAQQQRQEAHVDWSKQSTCVQRHLPRPLVPNTAVLRPSAAMKDVTGLQLAEELIKREMVAMMHHDALANPTSAQTGKPDDGAIGENRSQAAVPKGHHVANQERLLKFLRAHPIVDIDNDDEAMNHARALLDAEVETVGVRTFTFAYYRLCRCGRAWVMENSQLMHSPKFGMNATNNFFICPPCNDLRVPTWPARKSVLNRLSVS